MKIIGSERIIDFNKLQKNSNTFINDIKENKQISLFSSGRSAIYNLFTKIIKNQTILFPDYYCEEIINPILKTNNNIVFYKINSDFSVTFDNIKLNKNIKYIFIIDYFGFRNYELYEFAKNNNLKIISDRTHSLFSDFPLSDYDIGSFRKLFPVPDGGFVISSKRIKTIPNDNQWIYYKMYSKILRYIYEKQYTNTVLEKYYVEYSEYSEKNIIMDNSSISKISLFIIEHYSIKKYLQKRKLNFNFIKKHISSSFIIPIFSKLDKSTVPQCFPILINKRNRIKNKLHKEKIFIPVLWRNKNSISKKILNLHTDEEYNKKDIEREIFTLMSVYESIK